MKIRVLSFIIPALLANFTLNAAEIYNKDGNKLNFYGKIDGLHYFSSDHSADHADTVPHNDGDQSYMRLGINGETQISNQIIGFGNWESQINLNKSEADTAGNDFYTRVGSVGLKFLQPYYDQQANTNKVLDLGSIEYGRDYGVLYDVTGWTDILPEFGGDTYGVDNFLSSRATGVLTYRSNDFYGLVPGLRVALQYQGRNGSGEESNNNHSPLYQNGDGYGASISYDLPWDITAAAAFSNSRRTADQNDLEYGHGKRAEAYTGGLRYNDNTVYLAANYTKTYNLTRFGNTVNDTILGGFANEADNIELVAQYTYLFQNGSTIVPSVAYLQSKGKKIEHNGSKDLLKYVNLGATYNFNKNMSTYLDYKINLLDENEFTKEVGINTDNIVAVGLVYQF